MPAPYVHIALDKPRKLRFRHNDLADLEEQTGKGFRELVAAQTFHGLRVLLFYGLRWQDHKLTVKAAGELAQTWIDQGGTLNGLMEKIIDAMRASGLVREDTTAADAADDVTAGDEGDEGNADADASSGA